ncbi:MAG: hydroxyacid dehydrogenase [Saprospiraceae bacterium]|nr:hydroxyacid dehydrogenase [Saprospiraceae bacterium]
MQKERVLITDHVHPSLPIGLIHLGYEVDEQPDITLDRVRKVLGAYHGMVINSKIRVDRAMIEEASCLRFIARLGSGMEIIDRQAATDNGVAVFGAPEGNSNAVAEHALGMLLCLTNHLLRADQQVRNFSWHREMNRGWEIAGRTVGIVGMGHTGCAFARKLQGMGVHVLGHDKYSEEWTYQVPWVQRVDATTVQERADVLSLHLPLSEETRHYVNADYLARCKPGVVLINTSRGQCIDTRALVTALEDGRVRGACLDVMELEQPDRQKKEDPDTYNRLFGMDQVVLSPHIAGWSNESLERIAGVLLERIRFWKEK